MWLPFGLGKATGGKQATENKKQEPDHGANRKRDARRRLADLRWSRPAQIVLAVCVGLVIGSMFPQHQMSDVKTEQSSFISSQTRHATALQQTVDQIAGSCASKGNCKTFPLAPAQEAADLYARQCFTYSADAPTGEQSNRLKYAKGPVDCGYQGTGNGTVMSTYPDSLAHSSIMDSAGVPRADVGVVGTTVVMAGQADPLRYVTVIKIVKGIPQIASPGAFYSTPPTTAIIGCQEDTSYSSDDILRRLSSLEAGRVGSPNVDPTDYVTPGLRVARFGPSVTSIKVTDVTVCRGGDAAHRQVVAHEIFSGPVRGSQFQFTYGYDVQKGVANKWFVSGYGPVL